MKSSTPSTGTNSSTQSKFDMVKEAQAELQTSINEKRVELIDATIDHRSIGGSDDVKASLLALVSRYQDGIPYPYLQIVFPEAALTSARDALKKEGKIEQIGKKGNVVLRLKQS